MYQSRGVFQSRSADDVGRSFIDKNYQSETPSYCDDS